MAVMILVSLPGFTQEKIHNRIRNAGTVMTDILDVPKNIPEGMLHKASCVIVLPSVAKFAIGFGGSYGRGVMTCRSGENFDGPWSAPTMMALEGGSFGLQLGIQGTDYVLLASGGPWGRNVAAASDINMRAKILSFSRSRGAFAGVSLEGSTLRPDKGANKKIYGEGVTAKDIVINGEVQPPASAEKLLATLNERSPVDKSGNK
jgi:lipid-binding SYLF domain-containing protein